MKMKNENENKNENEIDIRPSVVNRFLKTKIKNEFCKKSHFFPDSIFICSCILTL